MRLEDLVKDIEIVSIKGPVESAVVADIKDDSRDVKQGDLFIACKGLSFDGHDYIDSVINKKVGCVVYEQDIAQYDNKDVVFIKVKDSRKVLISILKNVYEKRFDQMRVIGVTGTNGKTSVTFLVEKLLEDYNKKKVGVIGTLGYKIADQISETSNTTPGPIELARILNEMYEKDIRDVVMEVSSHGLDQGRVDFLKFSVACFTNLSHDHINYHKSIEHYFSAKQRLFELIDKDGVAVINSDCEFGKRLIDSIHSKKVGAGPCACLNYSVGAGPCACPNDDNAMIKASDIELSDKGSKFVLAVNDNQFNVRIPLIGIHNVYNVLAAIGIGMSLGLDIEIAVDSLNSDVFIPGRLEKIKCEHECSVFVDYAHTPDALKNVLDTIRAISKGKIILVFGCGGDRDKTKRPQMGKIAAEKGDFSIITNDNPRSEDPKFIIEQIIQGFKGDNFIIEGDREKAIQKALSIAKKNDIVIIAGKGHEKYQIIGDKKIYFSDQEAVQVTSSEFGVRSSE